ncbi:MAG: glycoside hydrolase family 13 protein [Chloroflexota bacterium]
MEPRVLPGLVDHFATPTWVQDAVFYQIFPDRFAASTSIRKPSHLEAWDSTPTYHGFKGGDLLGVVEHLDYLCDLGITAIYFTPVFTSTANHRYHTHDYYTIDPILGGDTALERLIDEAHQRKIRVVLDGVFNHASRGFYQFNHLLENGQDSPYIDWFMVDRWPLNPYPVPQLNGLQDQSPGYAAWWGMPALPKFNTSTEAVREFLWSVGEYWVQRGIDGWRLDVPNEIDDDAFWREFRRRVETANPDAYIVGEIWGDARRWLAGDQFDAVMNYLFTHACLGFFAGTGRGIDQGVVQGTGLSHIEPLDAPGFRRVIDELVTLYPQEATQAQLNLLGSHDTPRYLTTACGDESSLRLATLFQMSFPGAPCIYYGDEVGMEGGRDPDCRRGFPWDPSRWNAGLRDFVRTCVHMRHQYAALRHGSYRSLYAADGTYVFMRAVEDELVVVALNTASATREIHFSLDVPISDVRSALSGTLPDITEKGDVRWCLPARSGAVVAGRTRPA